MRLLIVANLGNTKSNSNGQTIKSIELVDFLSSSGFEIITENTSRWSISNIFFKFPLLFVKYLKAEKVIILPADRAVKFLLPFFNFAIFLKRKSVYYIVIGAWLSEFIKNNKRYLLYVRKLEKIYAETNILVENLSKMGLSNVKLLVNFKNLSRSLSDQSMKFNRYKAIPFKVCTLSRITERKGLLDLMNVINRINSEFGKTVYHLDIFGPIEKDFYNRFTSEMNNNISYRGELSQNVIIETLSEYFLLVFPTKIRTEGHPGTIIDAYSSGLPVISSRWDAANQFVSRHTGFIYEMNDLDGLYTILINTYQQPEIIENMRKNCYQESMKYDTQKILSELILDIRKS